MGPSHDSELAARSLLRERPTARVTLCPPKPNEFESATRTGRSTATFGAQSRSQSGSGVTWLMVGGIFPVRRREQRHHELEAPGAAEQMAGHRLARSEDELPGVVAEHRLDRLRLGDVAQLASRSRGH